MSKKWFYGYLSDERSIFKQLSSQSENSREANACHRFFYGGEWWSVLLHELWVEDCSLHIHHRLHDEGVSYCLWWWSLCREGLQCLRCLEALSLWIDFYVASSGVPSSCAHEKGAQGVIMIGGFVCSPPGPIFSVFYPRICDSWLINR